MPLKGKSFPQLKMMARFVSYGFLRIYCMMSKTLTTILLSQLTNFAESLGADEKWKVSFKNLINQYLSSGNFQIIKVTTRSVIPSTAMDLRNWYCTTLGDPSVQAPHKEIPHVEQCETSP